MADFRVIVTGSREDSIDPEPVHRELATLLAEHGERLMIKVGDCQTGVDRIALVWCKAKLSDRQYQVFYADWKLHGNAAGPIRNGNMVRSGGELCLGFNAGRRPFRKTGTCDCACQAVDAGIPVRIVPEGKGA